jgi:aminopeptidase YwaD
MTRLLPLLLPLLCCQKTSVTVEAPSPTSKAIKPSVAASEENLKQHLAFLTSEAMTGRRVLSDGAELTGRYIAEQMKEMGLSPNGDGGSFFEEITFYDERRETPSISLAYGGHETRHFEPLPISALGEIYNELIFVANGTEKEFEGLNVSGKVVLAILRSKEDTKDFARTEAYQNASKRGASAILFVHESAKAIQSLDVFEEATRGPLIAAIVGTSVGMSWIYDDKLNPDSLRPRRLSHYVTLRITEKTRTAFIKNVTGAINPKGPIKYTFLLGAHYDGVVAPAADDNASGVALLLETARLLARLKLPGVRVIVCAFADEERGLRGSDSSARSHSKKIHFMINFDMVGRMTNNTLYLEGNTQHIQEELHRANQTTGLEIKSSPFTSAERKGYSSDHESFIQEGIPAIHVFTGLHQDIHTDKDTLDKLDVASMARITNWVVVLLWEIASGG